MTDTDPGQQPSLMPDDEPQPVGGTHRDVSNDGPRFDPFKATLLLLLFSMTAVLCVLIATTIVVYRGGSLALEGFGDTVAPPQPTAILSTEAIVVQSLNGASELATSVFTMETVITESRDRTVGPWTVGNTRLLYVAHGQVKAGVDLSQLSQDDVQVGDDQVLVTLPPPEILDAKIDVDRSFVYDLDRSLLGPVDTDLQSRAERYALRQVVEAACESDILGDANSRAELTVSSLLGPMFDVPLAIKTQSPDPSGCVPGQYAPH